MDKVYDEPSEVTALEGDVIVEGPDGVNVSLTPDAAVETSDRLLKGGMHANGQRVAAARRVERRAEMHSKPPPEE